MAERPDTSSISAALGDATPGPWETHQSERHPEQWSVRVRFPWGKTRVLTIRAAEHNAHLIANAPTWLAQLLGALEAAEKRIEELETERDDATDEITDPWIFGTVRGLEWRSSELEHELEAVQRENASLREALKGIVADHGGCERDAHSAQVGLLKARKAAALAPSTQPSTEIQNPQSETAAEGTGSAG